jgi:hypothetical protein
MRPSIDCDRQTDHNKLTVETVANYNNQYLIG